MGSPGHDQYPPIPCTPTLSYRNFPGSQKYIRGREGRQAISSEEGSFVDVEVEFTHSKAIDFDHSDTSDLDSCSFAECRTMQTGLIQNAHDDLVTDAAYDFYGLHLATCSLDQRSPPRPPVFSL